MYCSSCGAEQPAPELNYCKNCGSPLNAPTIVHSANGQGLSCGAAWGIGISTFLLVVGGLGVLAAILSDLSSRPSGVKLTLVAVCGFAMLLVVALALICLPFTLTGSSYIKTPAANETKKRSWLFGKKEKPQPAPLFAPANSYAQLNEEQTPLSSVGSVTESTTRNLETVYREPRN